MCSIPSIRCGQALFVDSKAEKVEGARTVTIQTAQTSMRVRQMRGGRAIDVEGTLPKIIEIQGAAYLVTTVFVKYDYQDSLEGSQKSLESISICCLPNGMLQDQYNLTPEETFWLAGRNAPSRGEAFRVRVSLPHLKQMAGWRVQSMQMAPEVPFTWEE